ncbi:aminomethyl-transferring glycine dehydrogenase subunit GcvPA [Jannaschia seohaensis]|uniref:Glycine dehydrogenase subunit 1 n=1 Tax=Jannaschia seohaensis TaxID=475081 RepID=A0A2Y9AVL7_9RHOB|nr:aminomethyl-transferring glycine dehydrogenase subunit GcvPA [Jannaschia seohaensis]PWJ17037.1 glycine dehydrogenase subunit 1 [Jannaschia seohaensis]SSA48374.1 glycine dehydrogenase subunit 1 [Jannaschia seohaensis]
MASDMRAHPWMANSAPGVIDEMLAAIGAASVKEVFEQIPEDHFRKTPLDLPPALTSEMELRRDLVSKLKKNLSCEDNLSFLGAGVWQHHVPAVVDEIVGRTEFATNVWGSYQSDHGRNQTWFEFSSQLGALLNLDVVQLPVYSWGCAIGHAMRMAARITGRSKVLVPAFSDPERLSVIRTYCQPMEMQTRIEVVEVAADPTSGRLDLGDLADKLGEDVAAVYFENPAYLGTIETGAAEIAKMARAAGVETVVGVDPLSLGVMTAPGDYGADIVTGPVQPLGVHMHCGGGAGGFIASRDEERYVRAYNGFLVSVVETREPGQLGFGLACPHQNSYGMRENGNDWTGNSTYLWAIAGAVYMSLLGPEGFRELGQLIVSRARYAAKLLGEVPGVRIVWPDTTFKEFVVNFDDTGKTVAEVNDALRARGIFGGKDLSGEGLGLGQSALYCVTEVHTANDIRRLADTMKEILA